MSTKLAVAHWESIREEQRNTLHGLVLVKLPESLQQSSMVSKSLILGLINCIILDQLVQLTDKLVWRRSVFLDILLLKWTCTSADPEGSGGFPEEDDTPELSIEHSDGRAP